MIAGLLAYFGVHEFTFVFDDDNALANNEPLRAGDWWAAAFGDYNSLSNRPLSCLSLGLDFKLGLGPGSMHLISLAIHLANSVLVALVVRMLAGGNVLTASFAATIWAVHPLGVDARRNLGVAYLTLERPQAALDALDPLLAKNPNDAMISQLAATARTMLRKQQRK